MKLEDTLADNGPAIFATRVPDSASVGRLMPLTRRRSDAGAREGRFIFVLQDARDDLHASSIRQGLLRHQEFEATVIQLAGPGHDRGIRARVLGIQSTLQASLRARRALNVQLGAQPAAVIFVDSQASALLAARVTAAVPTVISIEATRHNHDALRGRRGPLWRLLGWAADLLNRRAYARARALVASSHWVADSLIRDYRVKPEKVHVLRPGVDLSTFRPASGAREPGPVRVLFVGADFLQRGGLDLLAAMGRLGERAELDIVSASAVGPLQPGLRWRVHHDLRPHSAELAGLYRRADIFALPSSCEDLATAIARAIACGLPVVACSTGATSELVIDGVNGFLVPPSDPLRLGRVIETLIDNPELRRTMGHKSLELAQQEHDSVRNIDSLFGLLRGAAATPHE